EINVGVPSTFLPGSQIGYTIGWRNAPRVDLKLYAVDLTRAVEMGGKDRSSLQWLETIDVSRLEPALAWSHDTKDDGRHRPGSAELKIEPKLEPGAYVLEARAGDARA